MVSSWVSRFEKSPHGLWGDKLDAAPLSVRLCSNRCRKDTIEEACAIGWISLHFTTRHHVLRGRCRENRTELLAARGCAFLNAFHMNLLVKPLGVWLSEWPSLLVLPSVATPWFELLWPWLLLLPATLLNGWLRIGTIVALLGLNFGIFVTLDVGFFYALYVACSLGLIALAVLGNRGIQVIRWKNFSTSYAVKNAVFFLIL